jgi:hypothetical protein
MRIISDFHDYYDSVQATGQDQTLVYYRKAEEVETPEYPFPVLGYCESPYEPCGPRVRQHIVGFCGKIYPVITLTQVAADKTVICYNLEEVDRFVEGNYRTKTVEEYRTGLTRQERRWGWRSSKLRRGVFEEHFSACAAKQESFAEIFVEKRCPVFVGAIDEQRHWRRSGTIVYNGSLKELEFFRLFDTYTAFQEIAMFLGGLAVPLKEIPEVPDKIMVGVKGFDQWSFRKPPTKRQERG